MAKAKPVAAVPKLVSILQSLDKADRHRAVQAAFMLMGDDPGLDLTGSGGGSGSGAGAGDPGRRAPGAMTAQAYFDAKSPSGKVEELAVAARYREEHQNATANSKAEIGTVVGDARRDFDSRNFNRDIFNARRNGFFNKAVGRDSNVLSHYGQRYVDALPNRDAARALLGGKKRTGPRKKRKAPKR